MKRESIVKILHITIQTMIIAMMTIVAMMTSADMDIVMADAIMITIIFKMTTRPADGVYLNGQCRNIDTFKPHELNQNLKTVSQTIFKSQNSYVFVYVMSSHEGLIVIECVPCMLIKF